MYEVEKYYCGQEYQFYDVINLCPDLNYVYEFGIYGGKSMLDLMRQAFLNGKPVKNFIGFDSFCGLPSDELEHCQDWYKGNFSTSDLFGNYSYGCASQIERLARILFPSCYTLICCGWFSEIEYSANFLPASFINIDCDLYESTVDALNMCYKFQLIKTGTVIRYDDMKANDFSFGEGKAHKEWAERLKIGYSQPYENKTIFRIEEINYA